MSTNRPQWSILSDRGKGVLIGHAGPTADVITATVPVRADARLIVEAVNAYDTLRAENARLRAMLEAVIDSADQWARAQGATSDPGLVVSVDWDAIQTARAALSR